MSLIWIDFPSLGCLVDSILVQKDMKTLMPEALRSSPPIIDLRYGELAVPQNVMS